MVTDAPPVLLGVFPMHRDSRPGNWFADLHDISAGECVCLFTCDAREYPIDIHCVYARHEGEETPYTFPHFSFHPAPPGIPVGPWPGWRGIPPMPRVEVRHNGGTVHGAFHFWGDERRTGEIRFVARIGGGGGRIDLRIDDTRITPLRCEVYTALGPPARDIAIQTTASQSGHPCLLARPDELVAIRAKTEGTHAGLLAGIERLLENAVLPFEVTPESKTLPGPERLGPQDETLLAAFLALLRGDDGSVARALDAYERYAERTRDPAYEPLKIDTQSGEALFALCLGYDWLYPHFAHEARERHRRRICEVAEICLRYMGTDRRDILQAHHLGVATGLLAFAILFRHEHETADGLLRHFAAVAERMTAMLPDDGSYHHGINLWIYEHGFLLRFLEMLRGVTGTDYIRRYPYFENASRFRGAAMTDDGLHAVAFGDPQYRVSGDAWMHFLIAARTGSPHAQWLGEQLAGQNHEGVDFRNVPPRRRVYECLFHDPSVPSIRSDESLVVFDDIGQVFMRSEDSVCTTRSGAPLGMRRYAAGEYGAYGHGDPANGALLFWRKGAFVLSGPGPVYRRESRLHNIFTVNGKGQLGDGCVWLPDFIPPEHIPPIPTCARVGDAVVVVMDLAAAYLPCLRVRRARRKLIVDPRSFIIGMDTIECEDDSDIEWNLHSRGVFETLDGDSMRRWRIDLPGGPYRLAVYSETFDSCETGLTPFVPAYPNDGVRDHYLRLTRRTRSASVVWSLTWD